MQFNIAKMILIIILIPVIFSIPLLLAGKLSNIWQESNQKKRDEIFVKACLSTIIIAAILLVVSFSSGHEILSIKETSILIFLVDLIYFTKKGYNKVEWQKLDWMRKRVEFKNLPFIEAWKTKYHWGTITQAILILLFVFI